MIFNKKLLGLIAGLIAVNISTTFAAISFTTSEDHVALVAVDPNTGNMLFRGPMPMDTDDTGYNPVFVGLPTVYNILENGADGGTYPGFAASPLNPHKITTFPTPNQSIFIDVVLYGQTGKGSGELPVELNAITNNKGDLSQALHQMLYTNPSQHDILQPGSTGFIWWEMLGYDVDMGTVPATIVNKQLYGGDTLDKDESLDYSGQMALIHQLMTTSITYDGVKVPVIIYAHCEAGADRTGEFVMNYLMQYGRYDSTAANQYASFPTLASALTVASNITTPELTNPGHSYQQMSGYYCKWLGLDKDNDKACLVN